MAKKKPIKLKLGKVRELAIICKTNTVTVWEALNFKRDTDFQEQIRRKAYELDFVRKF